MLGFAYFFHPNMEVPDTPAVFQDSRRETVSIMDRLVEQGSTEVQLTAMSDSASLVALSAQTLLEVLETFSPLLYETVPQAPRPFPATGEGDQTQEVQQNHLCLNPNPLQLQQMERPSTVAALAFH